MPPKKKQTKKPSWHDVRIGRSTAVANPIPTNLRKQSATRHDIEQELQYHVNKQNLEKDQIRLSPLTVSNKDYFNPSEDGKVTIKDGSTPRYTGKLTPITFDTVNPPSLLSYRGETIRPEKMIRSTSPLTYPNNYPGITGTGEKAAKRAERELASIRPRSYDGGKKTRRKKKRTRTRKRKRTRKKKKKRRRRTKKKRRRRR